MIELSAEARKAYEVMMLNLEQSSSAEAEQEVSAESEPQLSSATEAAQTSSEQTQPEQPDYCKCASIVRPCGFKHRAHPLTHLTLLYVLSLSHLPHTRTHTPTAIVKIWKKIVTNESKHTFLNFEEQLSFMHLESERIENGEEEKS